MALQRLSELEGWELEDSDQDIRGRTLRAHGGRRVGEIKDLMVDLDHERVTAVVTDQGESYDVAALEIGDEDVVAHGSPISGGGSGTHGYSYVGRVRRPR